MHPVFHRLETILFGANLTLDQFDHALNNPTFVINLERSVWQEQPFELYHPDYDVENIFAGKGRIIRALRDNWIESIGELQVIKRSQLLEWYGIGSASAAVIDETLHRVGFRFLPEEADQIAALIAFYGDPGSVPIEFGLLGWEIRETIRTLLREAFETLVHLTQLPRNCYFAGDLEGRFTSEEVDEIQKRLNRFGLSFSEE